MALTGYPQSIPEVEDKPVLRLATVWNTKRGHDPYEGGCPQHNSQNVSYYCLDKEFDISKWYLNYMKGKDAKCDMQRTLADPELGPGMLYYNIFRKYDALVVLAKNDTMKLNYGNVQRAVSQMRSGVPVLVEIRGTVLQDFVQRYNYTCAFQRYPSDAVQKTGLVETRKLWTFDEAVENLKSASVRKQCQREGLEIVKDYSPSQIGQKFLKTVGYKGKFLC
eukprot:CAMPEP_0178791338 /NCGR_PEP_ID=MMETSP0745-20121128/7934_1 /TAXON_ID=913974 /ORGANISM="Nitzschia punctata, Strain CCMP561" /LENGTH=220 /DNA_ID=CAMNT_0020449447 /DNA_START=1 /DNA_END=663 /DNA_ORIENTATION=+